VAKTDTNSRYSGILTKGRRLKPREASFSVENKSTGKIRPVLFQVKFHLKFSNDLGKKLTFSPQKLTKLFLLKFIPVLLKNWAIKHCVLKISIAWKQGNYG
jgi:hypothetical protein